MGGWISITAVQGNDSFAGAVSVAFFCGAHARTAGRVPDAGRAHAFFERVRLLTLHSSGFSGSL
jgi:hypothetical protein